MPVNEVPPDPEPSIVDRFVPRVSGAIGASGRMPVRVILLFILSICCVAVAPVPANMLGVAAVVLLALDTSLHRR